MGLCQRRVRGARAIRCGCRRERARGLIRVYDLFALDDDYIVEHLQRGYPEIDFSGRVLVADSDSPEDILAFYTKVMEDLGLEMEESSFSGGGSTAKSISGRSDEYTMSVTVTTSYPFAWSSGRTSTTPPS